MKALLVFLSLVFARSANAISHRFDEPPYDPLSNAVGSPCSTNISNLWIDIVLVVDISNATNVDELNAWAAQTLTYLFNVPFGPRGPHKTRAGLITYGTDSVTRLALSDGISTDVVQNAIFEVQKYWNSSDSGGFIQKALKAAGTMFFDTNAKDGYPEDIRKQVIILTAAAHNPVGFKGAKQTAQILKNDGIYIFTIDFITEAGVDFPGLDELASEGYDFRSDDVNLVNSIQFGLTQVNCFCPVDIQFYYSSGHNKTNYADCLTFFTFPRYPQIINRTECKKGSMLSVTSQIKLDFTTDTFNKTNNISQFIVGAMKEADGNWYWQGFNHTKYPLGQFPDFNPLSTDSFAYMKNYGNNWQLVGSTPYNALPYFCQNRACDADFICDQS